jgi:putative membrane protein
MEKEDKTQVSATDLAIERTGLAQKRTRWAADRTLWASDRTFIAWLRTAISMIGFGITIAKAGEALRDKGIIADSNHSLKIIGVAFMVLAVLGLLGALIQDIRIERRLKREGFGRVEPAPLGQIMGFCVLGVGIAGLVFAFL